MAKENKKVLQAIFIFLKVLVKKDVPPGTPFVLLKSELTIVVVTGAGDHCAFFVMLGAIDGNREG
jgi:hypothetical protein